MPLSIKDRHGISLLASATAGAALLWAYPFPGLSDPALALIDGHQPYLFDALSFAYRISFFTTPYFLASAVFSLSYIFAGKRRKPLSAGALPPYPALAGRQNLIVVVGEMHEARRLNPSPDPQWLVVPELGLFTGIAIFGAIGSGKTTCCMYPWAEQIFAFRHDDPAKRPAGLVLEVKGEFCRKVKAILTKWGRSDDYVEISLASVQPYNPLQNDLDAYSLAYNIAALLTSLFGRGREPFWQQAYTNMVKFIILLHRVLYDYVTLFDIYQCAIDPTLLEQRINEGRSRFAEHTSVFVAVQSYLQHGELSAFHWQNEKSEMTAPLSKELAQLLKDIQIPHRVENLRRSEKEQLLSDQFEAVDRWFRQDWGRIEPRLRTSIVEGISVFLSIFDDNPALKRIFCPPKACYETEPQGAPSTHPKALPPFAELIERGAVVALNLPTALNPGLARIIGTLMKLDFQRAMLSRIPVIEESQEQGEDRYFRHAAFICDEYHMFATAGESDPTGDEKFFALSRQAKCIPIVATQSISSLQTALPGESWRALFQAFRTKVFLATSDPFTARHASDLCGKDEHLKLSYTVSENGQEAHVNLLTGRTTAPRASVSASKTYSVQRDLIFEPKVFMELKNGQAVVLAYDGVNPLPPTYCYLKPYFLDPNRSYFEPPERRKS